MSFKTFQGEGLVNLFSAGGFPTVKGWNRLEGRPRTEEFQRTLKAEVRDALWMLSRQWQMGEFDADDAGSPAFAKVKVATTHLNRTQIRDRPARAYDETVPLEARVERGDLPGGLDLSLAMGRRWSRLLARAHGEGTLSREYRLDFRQAFPIELPPEDESGAPVYAHQEVWQLYAATAGRSVNGWALYQALRSEDDFLAAVTVDSAADETTLRSLGDRLLAWVERQYSLPVDADDSAWASSYLEYQMASSAPDFDGEGQIVLVADEYHQGHLDWHSFDIHPGLDTLPEPEEPLDSAFAHPENQTFDFLPTVIEFAGMPNVRWWEFENRKTHFGDIDAHTTDLARLLLIEFGLIYANDWFLLPFDLPVGGLARIEGLAVTNVFGERFWIEAAGAGKQDDWQRWSMYNLNVRGQSGPADRSIFLPPAVDRLLEGRPREEVRLIRDEMANMVWGVESRVPLASGTSKEGSEAATETVQYLVRIQPPAAPEEPQIPNDAKIRYVLSTSVPENWIPFLPVQRPQSNREIQLQRATMPRILPGSTERPLVRPRTSILRHRIDGAYFVHEEEVPRAGAQVLESFQRARWHDGKVCLWLGRRKRTGRGEGSSGLAFDQIRPKESGPDSL